VYLTLEAQDAGERAAFRARALAAGIAVGVLAAVVLVLAAPEVRHGLLAAPWAVPLHVAAGASAVAAWALVWRESYRPARLAAALQVAFVLWGWGLAQYPYAVRPELTLAEAAAPGPVRVVLLQVLAVGAVVLLPSLLYLFGVFGPRGDQAARGARDGTGG
jgi:cytochrome d ubiquinol oxidase subunit II